MALLRRKETPIAALERELADLVGRRNALDAKLADAAGELAQAFDQRRQALLDSDLSDEVASARRDSACRTAEDRHGSLVDALSAIGGKIADVEMLLIAARDRAKRQELARTIQHIADRLETETAAYADGGAKIIPLAQELVALMPGVADDFVPGVGELVTALPADLRQFVGGCPRPCRSTRKRACTAPPSRTLLHRSPHARQ